MKIATYNVNSVNARLPVLLRWLAETRPDVACLQELKAPQEKFPAEALREVGYRAIWHGQKAWNGVAILGRSSEPVETGRGLPGDPEDVHSRYLEGTVGDVRVGSPLIDRRCCLGNARCRMRAVQIPHRKQFVRTAADIAEL